MMGRYIVKRWPSYNLSERGRMVEVGGERGGVVLLG